MSGMRSSRPNANAAAWQCTGMFSMMFQVVPANSTDGAGTPASASASCTLAPPRSRSMSLSMAAVSAPASRMPLTYSSKWLMKPSPSSSDSSTITMSLMSLRLPVGPVGIQGTVDAGELALQRLQQRHEVPHREDVVLHERDDGLVRVEAGVERVLDDPFPCLADGLLESLDSRMRLAPVIPGQCRAPLVRVFSRATEWGSSPGRRSPVGRPRFFGRDCHDCRTPDCRPTTETRGIRCRRPAGAAKPPAAAGR